MPNGWLTETDSEELDSFFRPLAPTIEAFAARHNLEISKYYHDSPSWDLCFAHPLGGLAKLAVVRRSPSEFQVSGVWWRDDYDSFTRHSRSESWPSRAAEPELLAQELSRGFAEVLAWREMTEAHRGYDDVWSGVPKMEFQRLGPHFPKPRV